MPIIVQHLFLTRVLLQVSLLEGFAGQLYEKRAPETSKYEISCFISIHMFSLHLGVSIEQVEEKREYLK